jgi:phosphatidylglycerol lysyltransferase
MKKRWIILTLTVLFVWLVISSSAELEQLKITLAQSQWGWLLAAALSQVVYYSVFASSYQAAFYTIGIQTRIRDLIPITLASLFINVVIPAAGAGGVTLFAEDLARRGKSEAGAATGVLLQLIADFSAFTLLLIPGMVYLFIEHSLKTYEIAAAVILMLLNTGLTSIFLLGIRKPERLEGIFGWFQRTVNRLFCRLHRISPLTEDWVQKNTEGFNLAAEAVARHPSRLLLTVGAALLAHILDITTLYILFLAFNQPIRLGVLVAGYAIGILFWIVAITPQGIGVVEGMMALTFTSLGIPGAVAAAITLAFRGLTFWLPLAVGFFMLRRTKVFNMTLPPLANGWEVRVVALSTAVMGLVNVISAITPSFAARVQTIEKYSPLEVRHGSHLTAALAGFALLLLARSLWRRKHLAWLLTLIVLCISMASHLLKGLDYEEALLAGMLALWLFTMRSHFYARSDPPSMRQGLQTLVAALEFTLIYGTLGFYLLDNHFQVTFGLAAALHQTLIMFTQFYDPGLQPITSFGRYFADSIYAIGGVTLGYALIMLARPVLVHHKAKPEDRARAQQIAEKYGRSSLARLTLLDDKVYFFSPGGSLIAYVVQGRIALVLGDPIGPADDFYAALESFQSLCNQNDWIPAFYQTLPDSLESYHSRGFSSLNIGAEAIIDLAGFTLEGRSNKGLRSAYNRLMKLGHHARLYLPPLPDDVLRELYAVSNEWLADMHGSEKRFSLGWFDEEYIRNSPVMVVQTPQESISAFANIISEYTLNEVSIDLMRHRSNALPGTMDYLFVALFEWARDRGYDTFNLGLSALSGIGEHNDDPAIEKGLHFIYEHINQFYNYQGLHAYKEKFHPVWSSRYLIYTGVSSLPAVAAAIIRADSGDFSLINLVEARYVDHRELLANHKRQSLSDGA